MITAELVIATLAGTYFLRNQLPGYLASDASAQTPGDTNSNDDAPGVH